MYPCWSRLAQRPRNAVEPVLGAACALWFCHGMPDLTARADLLKFVVGAVALGPLAGGLIWRELHRGPRRRLGGDADGRELGDSLADASTVGQVAERVAGAVRGRLGASRVVVDVQADLPTGSLSLAASPPLANRPARSRRRPATASRSPPGSGAVATVPLPAGLVRLGDPDVQWAVAREISVAQREYLQAVGETTSRAVERARLREAERAERERIETLSARTRHLAAGLTAQAIGQAVSLLVDRSAVGAADGMSLGVLVSTTGRGSSGSALSGIPNRGARSDRRPVAGRQDGRDRCRAGPASRS